MNVAELRALLRELLDETGGDPADPLADALARKVTPPLNGDDLLAGLRAKLGIADQS